MASWNLTMTACSYTDMPSPTRHIIAAEPRAHWLLGDPVYHALAWTMYETTISGVVLASAPSVWLSQFDQIAKRNAMADLFALRQSSGMKMFYVPDDHGWGGDNWDHTVAKANTANSIGAVTLADVLAHWNNGLAGQALIEAAYTDNPARGAPNGNIPSAMVGTASANAYPVRYFATDFGSGGEHGGNLVRVLTLDCISYKSPVNDTDNSSKTMLGAAQLAWANSQIQSAMVQGFRQVIVMSSKDLFNIDNSDGWFRYATERDSWLSFLHSINAPVVFMCGDRHTPHASVASTRAGDAYNAVCVTPCSFGVPLDTMTFYPQNTWQSRTNSQHVFGRVTIDEGAGMVRLGIVDAIHGRDLRTATVALGGRTLAY